MYVEKTTSAPHQVSIFHFWKNLLSWGLFWEQGVGKTKPAIDKFCYLYEQGKVQALFVVAPNNVHLNWTEEEIPKHMPDSILEKAAIYLYRSSKAKQRKEILKRQALLMHKGPVILCMSYNGMRTKMGKAFARKFMLKFQCFGVADESQSFKSPGAKITPTVVASGRYMPFKTILSGTPVTQGPFDVYSQVKFLDEDFWKKLGLEPFSVYKTHFGIFRSRQQVLEEDGWDPGYDQCIGYKNVDELAGYLKLITHRLTKDTAGIKLPPKVYTKRFFDLTPAQMRCYVELEEDLVTQLPESGDVLEVLDRLTLGTRLAQIVCGYVATEAGEPVQRIDDKNPRLQCLKDTLELTTGKAIIWSRFTPDIDLIMEMLTKMGRKPVRYDGKVGEDERQVNKRLFQEGDATDFVAHYQSAFSGLTLHAAESCHYYCNTYNWGHRAQSEDRAHRFGLKHTVVYYDYIANNTMDLKVVQNLLKKHRFAQQLLGDAPTDWIG
jgi:Mesyanzhinovviridae DNA helicase